MGVKTARINVLFSGREGASEEAQMAGAFRFPGEAMRPLSAQDREVSSPQRGLSFYVLSSVLYQGSPQIFSHRKCFKSLFAEVNSSTNSSTYPSLLLI